VTDDEAPAVLALGDGSALAFAWRRSAAIRRPVLRRRRHPARARSAGRRTHRDPGATAARAAGPRRGLAVPRVTDGGDADDGQLILRRYTPAGAGIGAAVVVADDVESGPAALAISGDDVGLAWAACAGDSDGDGCGIRFRAYDGNLTPRGDALPVNSTIAGDQEDPSIGWLPDRSVAVTFSDTSASAPDRDQSAVRARIIYPAAP
jgi:hypothetical protein